MNQNSTVDFTQAVAAVAGSGLFPSLCTIKATATPLPLDTAGQPNYSTTPISGLTNIPCMIAPEGLRPDQGGEIRGPENFDTLNLRRVILSGYYPQITTQNVANIDGVDYEIMSVEAPSQEVYTRMAARTFNV